MNYRNDNSVDFTRALIGFTMGILLSMIVTIDASVHPDGATSHLLQHIFANFD